MKGTARIKHHLYRVYACGLLIAATLASGGCPMPPPPMPKLNGRVVVIGMPTDNLPYSEFDSVSDAPHGLDYELISKMAEVVNFSPRFVELDPSRLFDELAAGRIDVAGGGIAYSIGRIQRFQPMQPYALVKLRLVVRGVTPAAESIAAFKLDERLRAGVLAGTWPLEQARLFLGASRAVSYPSQAAAVAALLAGEIDGVVLDDPQVAIESQRSPGALRALEGPFAGAVIGYLLPQQSDLLRAMNAGMQEMYSNGELTRLHRKWGL